MAKVHRFRRLRHGEPRKLSTPDFVRAEQARNRARRGLGILVVVALIAAALVLFGSGR